MEGKRIQFRSVAFNTNSFTPILPGEPVFDPSTKRFGIGTGGFAAAWYPIATKSGDLQFDVEQGLVSADGQFALKFTARGIVWRVNNNDVLAIRNTQGIAIKTGMIMRNDSGADVVVVGWAHYVAMFALITNIKALLRKFLASTAVSADVDALLTPGNSYNLPNLDPSFPEASSL